MRQSSIDLTNDMDGQAAIVDDKYFGEHKDLSNSFRSNMQNSLTGLPYWE